MATLQDQFRDAGLPDDLGNVFEARLMAIGATAGAGLLMKATDGGIVGLAASDKGLVVATYQPNSLRMVLTPWRYVEGLQVASQGKEPHVEYGLDCERPQISVSTNSVSGGDSREKFWAFASACMESVS